MTPHQQEGHHQPGAVVQQAQQAQENRPCRVNWLLELTDPALEQACRQYRLHKTYLLSDAAVLIINAVANATMLLRLRMLADLPISSRLGLVANLFASLCHVAIVRQSPRQYMHWRTFMVAASRLLRVLLVLSVSSSINTQPASWLALLLQYMMLSPASASFLSAVGLPLPLRQHLVLQLVVTMLTLSRVYGLCGQLSAGAAEGMSCSMVQHLSQQFRWLNLFNLRLLPCSVAPGRDCCLPVLTVVIVGYSVILSTIAVYTIDMAARVSFLHRVAALPRSTVALLSNVVRSVWLVGCITCLSLLPVVWELSVLYHKVAVNGLVGYGSLGLAAALTSLFIESFMRVWLALVLLVISSSLFTMVGA